MKTDTHNKTAQLVDLTRHTNSQFEELVCLLSLIAGLLARQSNIHWLAWLLFIKSAHDLICCLVVAVQEIRKSLTK
jgi:hypothetical protein